MKEINEILKDFLPFLYPSDKIVVPIKNLDYCTKIDAFDTFEQAKENIGSFLACYIKSTQEFYYATESGELHHILPAINFKLYMQIVNLAETWQYILALQEHSGIKNPIYDNLILNQLKEMSNEYKKEWSNFYETKICDFKR